MTRGSKVNVELTEEFDMKGIPFEKTKAEFEQEEMRRLENFFRKTGEGGKLPLALLATALTGVRDAKADDAAHSQGLKSKFGYRWRAHARIRTASKEACQEQAAGAPAGGPGADASSVAPASPSRPAFKGRLLVAPAVPVEGASARAPALLAQPTSPSSRTKSPTAGSTSPSKAPSMSARRSPSPRATSVMRHTASSKASSWLSGVESKSPRGVKFDDMTNDLWDFVDTDDKLFHQMIIEQGRRPITPAELQAARAPTLLSPSDLPPIFQRPATSLESHYEYFRRRLPVESAARRDFKQQQVIATRRTLNYGNGQFGGTRSLNSPTLRSTSGKVVLSARESRPSTREKAQTR